MDVRDLLAAIRESTHDAIGSDRSVAVAYSGGLDSSIVARVASEFCSPRCYTSAVTGSHDHTSAERLAREELMRVELLMLDQQSLVSLVEDAGEALDSDDPVSISYTVPVLHVVQRCEERLILVGSGADELFAGYAKYCSMEDPTSKMRADLEKALADLAALHDFAATSGKRVVAPLASERVQRISDSIPIADKIRGNERKIALREVAKELGLSSHARQKKAAQYSSGVLRQMKRLAKSEHLSLSEWTAKTVRERRDSRRIQSH